MDVQDEEERHCRVVELNVQEQCLNLFKTGVVQRRRSETYAQTGVRLPQIHGLVYDIHEGLLKELAIDYDSYAKEVENIYKLY